MDKPLRVLIVEDSEDGGMSWRYELVLPENVSPIAVSFINNNDGWLLESVREQNSAGFCRLLKTVNGGASWQIVSPRIPTG